MNIPKELRYTKTHEWAQKNGASVRVGITDYAQHEISDVVFAELPKIGQDIGAGKAASVVESVKAAFDIYAPVAGKIAKVNSALESNPGLINQDCYGDGWLFELTASDNAWESLMNAEQYAEHLKQEAKH